MSFVDNYAKVFGHTWDDQLVAMKSFADAGIKASDILNAAQKVKNNSYAAIPTTARWADLETTWGQFGVSGGKGVPIAHRGGVNVFPEDTITAFRAAVAAGVPALEFRVYKLRDGTLAVMHDSTLTRTSTSTGNTVDQTGPTWATITLDPSTYTGPTWPNIVGPPTLAQVLNEFGGKVAFIIALGTSGAKQSVVDIIVARKLQDSVIINSSAIADLAPAVTAGIRAQLADNTGATAAATITAAGVGYVSCKTTGTSGAGVSQATIDAYVAAGIKVHVNSPQRYSDLTPYTKVSGWMLDEPLYIKGHLDGAYQHRLTVDPWDLGMFYHGHVPAANNAGGKTYNGADGPGRGTIAAGGKFQQAVTGTGFGWVLAGFACPLANPSGTYSITFTVTMDVLDTDATRWSGIFVCAASDKSYGGSSAAATNDDGFQFIIRENGTLQVDKNIGGVFTATVATQATAAISAGGTAILRVDVTPTSVTLTRTDVSAPNTVTISTDTTVRGAYFHFGSSLTSGSTHSFSDVTVA